MPEKPQFPLAGMTRSDRNQFGVVNIDLPNRAGRRARTTNIQITVIIAGQPFDGARRRDQSRKGGVLRER